MDEPQGCLSMEHSNWTICKFLFRNIYFLLLPDNKPFIYPAARGSICVRLRQMYHKVRPAVYTLLGFLPIRLWHILGGEGSVCSIVSSHPRKETVAFSSLFLPIPPFLRPPSGHCPPPSFLLSPPFSFRRRPFSHTKGR